MYKTFVMTLIRNTFMVDDQNTIQNILQKLDWAEIKFYNKYNIINSYVISKPLCNKLCKLCRSK